MSWTVTSRSLRWRWRITGQENFEILSGVNTGDSIVAGPYQEIRDLKDGDPVQAQEDEGARGWGIGGMRIRIGSS